MHNFWHFGDSYSMNDFSLETKRNGFQARIQIKNFGHIISKKLNRNYKFAGVTGFCNEQIFQKILGHTNRFKKGDIIFINWSYFTRGSYVNKKGDIHSTNCWFDENMPGMTTDGLSEVQNYENYNFIMDYILNYNYDFNTKLFKGNVIPYFDNLIKKGITIYNLFINENEKLKFGKELQKFKIHKKMGYNNKFNEGYVNWLKNLELHGEEEGHYSSDKQEFIAEEIHKRMQLSINLI